MVNMCCEHVLGGYAKNPFEFRTSKFLFEAEASPAPGRHEMLAGRKTFGSVSDKKTDMKRWMLKYKVLHVSYIKIGNVYCIVSYILFV